MKTVLPLCLFHILISIFSVDALYAQNLKESPDISEFPVVYDQRVLLHYSSGELDTLRQVAPEKYGNIVYYHTRSYLIETYPCIDCIETFDINSIDISRVEAMRMKSERVTVEQAKQGYRIILLAADELQCLTPLQKFRFGL